MAFAKSNALSLPVAGWGGLAQSTSAAATASSTASAPATGAVGGTEAFMLGLVSLGLCVLMVWIVRRVVRPAKVSLIGTPDRPNRLNPAHILVLLLVWQAAGAAAVGALGRWFTPRSDPLAILAALVQQTVWLVTSLAVAAMTFRHGLRRGMGWSLRHWIYDSARGVVAYLAVLPICFGLFAASKAVYWALHHQPSPEHQLLVAMRHVSWPWQIMAILSGVVLAPLAEEVFCRGLLQSMFRRYTHRPWAAVVLSSVIFALLHWDSLPSGSGGQWVQMPALLALGVVLGYNYERSGRLVAPIVVHALFNGVSMGVSLGGG
jgi:membrane protease YdiL (CAAX protease family)